MNLSNMLVKKIKFPTLNVEKYTKFKQTIKSKP